MGPPCDQTQTFNAKKTPADRRPLIIPAFLPHAGCPHQCVFCNQKTITGNKLQIPGPGDLDRLIHQFLEFGSKRRSTVQLAFYGGNFLGLHRTRIINLLEHAAKAVASGTIDSIRFSTRPDTISPENLSIIDNYPVQTVELGAQSMDNRVLELSRRGHSAENTVTAVDLLRGKAIEIGLQMMVGLPGEDEGSCLSSGRSMADLSPDFVRIYPTLVLKGSLLARWYREGRYEPLTLETSVRRVAKLYRIFEAENLPVIRMGLQASDALEKEDAILAGPYHPSFGEFVYSEVFYERASALIQHANPMEDKVFLRVHPKSISKLIGNNNNNIKRLKKDHQLRTIRVVPDSTLSIYDIDIQASSG